MMLLDTDMLVDIALDQHPHSSPASELLDRIKLWRESRICRVAFHIEFLLRGCTYARRPGYPRLYVELTRFVTVAITNTEVIHYAAKLPMTNFEDAVQAAAALDCGARHIVTRNIRDHEQLPHPRSQSGGGTRQIVPMAGRKP